MNYEHCNFVALRVFYVMPSRPASYTYPPFLATAAIEIIIFQEVRVRAIHVYVCAASGGGGWG